MVKGSGRGADFPQLNTRLTPIGHSSEGCTALQAVLEEPDSNTPPLPFAA